MYSGYGHACGVERWNNERGGASRTGRPLPGIPCLRPATAVVNDCGCETAHCLYCDQGSGEDGAYLSPELDDAPWYDPDIPESAEFAGLFVEDITGFDSTVTR